MPPYRVHELVGREAQLDVADGLIDAAVRGRGSLLVLSGEPGIGKTRLAEEIADRARSRGARTAWATAWRGDGAPALWPWVQVLRQLVGSAGVLEASRAESPTASPAARFAQLEAIEGVLRDAVEAGDGPIVVVLDDLQWADSASLKVLVFLGGALRDARCLLVATYRSEELGRDDMAELARVATSLAVPRLSAEAAVTLLRASAGGEVDPVVGGLIAARSGGNPLFVWEFGQLIAESGRFDIAPAAVPAAVTAVIERRLAHLPERVLVVVRAAAVLGGEFSADVVAGVAEVALDTASEALGAAAALGIIVGGESPGTMSFSHDLVREVVVDGIDANTRERVHQRAAAIFEERCRTDPSFFAVVADHLEHAGSAHIEMASKTWERAAQRATRMLAYAEAAACYARAARTAGPDRRRVTELQIAEGDSRLLDGDLEAARSCFAGAVQSARAIEDPELLARSVLGFGTGSVAWEVPIGDMAQVRLVEQALAALPSDATRLRSALLARLSVAGATPETLELARSRAEDALALAEDVGDPALIGQALAALNDAIAGPAHTMMRRENAATIVELARAAGDRALELLGYRFLVVADLEAGDIAAVDRDITAFARLAEELRQPLISWYVPLFRGMRAHLSGDQDSADRFQARVADAAARLGSTNARLLSDTLRFAIDVARGRTPDPHRMDGMFDINPGEWASLAAGMASLAWYGGDPERARALLDQHATNGFSRVGDDSERLGTIMLFGRVAVGLGDLEAARRLYELLKPHAGLWIVDGIAAACWGPVELELGRLAVALGWMDQASAHLEQAADAASRVGARMVLNEVAALRRRIAGVVGTAERPAVVDSGRESGGNVFRRDGQFWTLTFVGETIRMRDAKGLADLARLVAEPGRELHVLELAGARGDAGPAALGGDLGELLDARARSEYRRRLEELDEELADAEAHSDAARLERAQTERDFLAAELAGALGLKGRPRRVGDPVERARKAVTGRIRLAIGRIDAEHPALARHLSNAVRTGTFCVYNPESPQTWAT